MKNRMVQCRFGGHGPRAAELTIGARSEIRFLFVLFVNNCGRDELWTNESWLVDGLGSQLRRFRKSHQLIRDRSALIRGDRESDSEEIAKATPRDRRSDV